MKLCRFELKATPGEARSGMVYGGKIYETDGAQALGVYEADSIRPLAPIPQPPSLRMFRSDLQPEQLTGIDADEPRFFYGNPACLTGASQIITYPDFAIELSVEPYVAGVVLNDAYQVDADVADDLLLGLTLMLMLVSKDVEREERRAASGFGRSHDIAGVIGPVLTTPDELDDKIVDAELGRRYGLSAVLRVNGVDQERGNLQELPLSFAQALAAASRSCTLKSGDVVALGPVTAAEKPLVLERGDEVQLAVETLGVLSLKISDEL